MSHVTHFVKFLKSFRLPSTKFPFSFFFFPWLRMSMWNDELMSSPKANTCQGGKNNTRWMAENRIGKCQDDGPDIKLKYHWHMFVAAAFLYFYFHFPGTTWHGIYWAGNALVIMYLSKQFFIVLSVISCHRLTCLSAAISTWVSNEVMISIFLYLLSLISFYELSIWMVKIYN